MLFALLLAVLLLFSAAALADTVYSLSPAPAQVSLKDNKNYTVLTADNVDQNMDILRSLGVSKNELLADFESRGVILQNWSSLKNKKHTCLEITVTKDDESGRFPDLAFAGDDKEAWNAFIDGYKKSDEWTGKGYTFQSWDRKKAGSVHYLLMKYVHTTHRGYMARTTHQGYTITFDFQAYNQLTVQQHATNLYNVINTFQAVVAGVGSGEEGTAGGTGTDETGAAPAAPANSVPLTFNVLPPEETNTNSFTVEGVTEPGAHVIGVLMRISSPDSILFETDAHARTGNFKLKVTVPEAEETYWMMTLNVFVDDKLAAEKAFSPILYKKTIIPVTLDSEVPASFSGTELVISGTTMKAVDVQCIATCADYTYEKGSRPNGTGRFTFKIPLKYEGDYSIALVFSRKNYETKRLTFTVTRALTEDARNAELRKQAKRVGYHEMSTRTDQYVGTVLTFGAYVTSIEQIGSEWKTTVAGSKSGDHYSQYIILMSDEEPGYAVEEKHTFYGKCIGPFQTQSEEGTESLPAFDLLLWD